MLENLKKTLNGFYKGKFGQELVFEEIDTQTIRTTLFTENNRYAITARANRYLGCTSSARKPRIGETWTRGSDLADGDLTQETFDKIMHDIVSNEVIESIGAFVGGRSHPLEE